MVRCIALIMMAAMALPPVVVAQSTDVWGWLPGLPPGTRLKLVLSNGSDLTGTLLEATEDRVVLADTRPRRLANGSRFARADITSASVLAMAKQLHAGDRPNGAAARNVIRALGVGKRVRVTTTAGSWKSKIARAEDVWFELSQEPAPVRIDYSDVRDIEPAGMSASKKAGIAVGAGLGVFVGMIAICYRADCSGR